MTDVYKQALCLFIQEGVLTLEQVQEQVRVVESTLVTKSRQTAFWDAAKALCERLNAGIVANSHRPFRMNPTAVAHMEKLLRIDKVSVEEAESMVDWCVGHEFWSTVIFSPVKFRKHFETMRVRRVADGVKRTNESGRENHPTMLYRRPETVSDEELLEEHRRRQEEAVPMPTDFKRVLGFGR